MKIIYDNDNSFEFFDLYHALANEIQIGIAELLNQALSENKIGNQEQRKQIVSAFLFRFMSALDSQSPVTLDSATAKSLGATSAEKLEILADEWIPALCFLKHAEGNSTQSSAAIETVFVCTNTALHETSLEISENCFEQNEGQD